jgi:hypothetical protein
MLSHSLAFTALIALALTTTAIGAEEQGTLDKLKEAATGQPVEPEVDDCNWVCTLLGIVFDSDESASTPSAKRTRTAAVAPTHTEASPPTYGVLDLEYVDANDGVAALSGGVDTGPVFLRSKDSGLGFDIHFRHFGERQNGERESLSDGLLLIKAYATPNEQVKLSAGLGFRGWDDVEKATGLAASTGAGLRLNEDLGVYVDYTFTQFERLNLNEYRTRLRWKMLTLGYTAQHATDAPTIEGPSMGLQLGF